MGKRVSVKWDVEFNCYDVEVFDPEATVEEFEEECRSIFSGDDVPKKFSDSCIGCSLCCSERIPLTRIDLIRIKRRGGRFYPPGERELQELAREIVETKSEGRCIDVTLKVDECMICLFWVKDRGICSVYPFRPFACGTYICAPVSRRFEELRSQIINKGQDDLVSFLFRGQEIDEAYKYDNAFAGAVSYSEIRIRDVVTKRLWRGLYDLRR